MNKTIDYVVLLRADGDVFFWPVPRRKATKRIFKLLEDIKEDRLKLLGWMANVGPTDEDLIEAYMKFRTREAMEGKDIVTLDYVYSRVRTN